MLSIAYTSAPLQAGGLLTASEKRIVEEIISRVSLREVVEEYVALRRAGREYKGLCPFHHETSPSFYVIEDKRFFYCFGCHTGGDVIKFLQLAAGMTRQEAIQRLAQRAGISIRGEISGAQTAQERHRAQLLHALQVAHEFFRACLKGPKGEPARTYLRQRGVPDDIVETYGLGYGGPGDLSLVEALKSRGVSLAHAEEVGLVSRTGSVLYERFSRRLLFPIFNLDGAVVAFSGRILPPEEEGPKYLNSPDSPVFRKGAYVFGLYQARGALRRERRAIIVEGNFDVLAMAASGIPEAVAPLGTALTPEQLRTIKRFANSVVVMFDGDEAGRKASRRAVGLLIEAGIEGRIALLPKGEDPASLAFQGKGDVILEAIKTSRPMISWFIESLVEVHGRTPHGLRAVVEEAREAFRLEQDAFRYGLYCEELARVLGVDVRRIRGLMRRNEKVEAEREEGPHCPSLEKALLELFLVHPRLLHDFLERGSSGWITHREARDILGKMMNLAIRGCEEREIREAMLQEIEEGRGGLLEDVARALTEPQKFPDEAAPRMLSELMQALERRALMREREPLLGALKRAQEEGDEDEVERLQRRLSEINHRIATLRFRADVRGEDGRPWANAEVSE